MLDKAATQAKVQYYSKIYYVDVADGWSERLRS